MALLSQFITLKGRYHRSVNLERDLHGTDALEGYVVTPRSAAALERILSAIVHQRASRAWTLTGAYGTGKSSFAHFLLSLCAESQSDERRFAQGILNNHNSHNSSELRKLGKKIEMGGLVRAVATAQREPIAHTVLKAIDRGASEFWSEAGPGRRPLVLNELRNRVEKLKPSTIISSSEVIGFVEEVAAKSKAGLVLIIDELGKGLEYAALSQSDGDLFLLQQLAELRAEPGAYILGLLHQSFAEYGQALSSTQRAEWSKIQGRFEDIPFTNSAAEALRLMSHAIDYAPNATLKAVTKDYAKRWHKELSALLQETSYTQEAIADLLPIHPVTAIALPLLCNRFAQNDRSLFTFLTSDEAHSFAYFLQNHEFNRDSLPTLKLSSLYDYFVNVVGANLYSRPHLSRWVEIQGRITESHGLDDEEIQVLKSVGILNLIATAGTLRASLNLVALSLCDSPDDQIELARWKKVISSMIDRRIIAHRKQLDELRVWEGSDFDINQATQDFVESDTRPLDEILNRAAPLGPVVAQRHSYHFGTFRYFERRFVSTELQLQQLRTIAEAADGLVAYWVSDRKCLEVPSMTADGKPLVVIGASNVVALRRAAHELNALQRVGGSPELQTDGVAKREVRQRTLVAKRHLEEVLSDSFNLTNNKNCWALGKQKHYRSWRDFMASLSSICDEVYCSTPILNNELVNRRELTSQGAKARRELLEALLTRNDLPHLGLTGFGPEVSMYRSVLSNTGIHTQSENGDTWLIGPPQDVSLLPTWNAIERYCLESVKNPRTVTELFELLSHAPYGLKSGVLPILFAAVLIHHDDDICIYRDGTFIPILGPEHFELLVKDSSRFAVKHFVTSGLRAQIFKEIEELVAKVDKSKRRTRNASLLSVVTPLTRWVSSLPAYTKKTSMLNEQTKAIRDAIVSAKQPDELLFTAIPVALGLGPIIDGDKENISKANDLRVGLLRTLRELQTAYDEMINLCQQQVCDAFRVEASSARQALRARGLAVSLCSGQFDSFVAHLIDERPDDRAWFAQLLMIIGDKPTESWRDEDVELFRDDVVTYAKRFANFEAVQSTMRQSPGVGFEARKITLTQPSGKEEQKILWIETAKENRVNALVDEIHEKLSEFPDLQDAVLSKLTESLLAETSRNSRRKEA